VLSFGVADEETGFFVGATWTETDEEASAYPPDVIITRA
jgi:hypothetical protein